MLFRRHAAAADDAACAHYGRHNVAAIDDAAAIFAAIAYAASYFLSPMRAAALLSLLPLSLFRRLREYDA